MVIRKQQREVGCRKYGQVVALGDLLTTLFFPSFYCSGAEEWTQSLSHAICTLSTTEPLSAYLRSFCILPTIFFCPSDFIVPITETWLTLRQLHHGKILPLKMGGTHKIYITRFLFVS